MNLLHTNHFSDTDSSPWAWPHPLMSLCTSFPMCKMGDYKTSLELREIIVISDLDLHPTNTYVDK